MRAVFILISLLIWGQTSAAQEFSALARLDGMRSAIIQREDALIVDLSLSQGVPYRAFTLAEPARLVLDFREVDFSGAEPGQLLKGAPDMALRFGAVRPGWSRLVLLMNAAFVVTDASMTVDDTDGTAALRVALSAAQDAEFAARSGAPKTPGWAKQAPVESQQKAQDDGLTIMLDPGHGGIDPGAQGDGITEAQLMLILARELRDALIRAGDFNVVLTRNADVFVSLERRVQLARAAQADIFISLHADALASGKANGASVFTLSEEATDKASAALAERHNRADLLAGVDLAGQDDEIAKILMDLARVENGPRSDALARGIILGINTSVGHTYKRPIQRAGFSVLKAADIPSVLVEVGFLSSADDLGKLLDPEWRGKMVKGIRNGIQAWLLTDAADAQLRRK